MPTDDTNTVPDMTGAEFIRLCGELGFATSDKANDLGISGFCRFIGADPRTGRAWARDGAPAHVAVMLRLMKAAKIDAAEAHRLLRGRRSRS